MKLVDMYSGKPATTLRSRKQRRHRQRLNRSLPAGRLEKFAIQSYETHEIQKIVRNRIAYD